MSSASRSTKRSKPAVGSSWGLWVGGAIVLTCVALPAFLASRPPALPQGKKPVTSATSVMPPKAEQHSPSRTHTAQTLRPSPAPQVTRTRATTAWELSDGGNPHEAAAKIHELLREETDDRVRCEILGAASTLDATPALRQLFEESSQGSQPSRVRQVALDLWLTVYPEEAPTIARRFLTDADEEVRGLAEEYFLDKQEEARAKAKE